MRKILLLLLSAALISGACFAESDADFIKGLYTGDQIEMLEIEGAYEINISNAFAITLPGNWLSYDVTEAQRANGIFACYGDGEHYVFISAAEDTYPATDSYAAHLATVNGYSGVFTREFNGELFALYNNYPSKSSDAAIVLPGKGIITFYFYPVDGDADFANQVIDIMNSFRLIDDAVTEGEQ